MRKMTKLIQTGEDQVTLTSRPGRYVILSRLKMLQNGRGFQEKETAGMKIPVIGRSSTNLYVRGSISITRTQKECYLDIYEERAKSVLSLSPSCTPSST